MAKKQNAKPQPGDNQKEEGITWLTNLDLNLTYTEPVLDAEKARNYEDNYYIRRLLETQRSLIFQEEPEYYEVRDPDGEPDSELTSYVTQMLKKVHIWDAFQVAHKERCIYGTSPFNPVWGQDLGSYYSLQKLRHLPAYTFRNLPSVAGKYTYFSEILKGIVLNETGELEYHQTQSDNQVHQLKNVVLITDPLADSPVGDPAFRPIFPIAAMLSFCWVGQMQKMNRLGAGGVVFLKITGADDDDLEYGKELLRNWGKNTGWFLRENFELVVPNIPDNATALDTIAALQKMMDDYVSPTAAIRKDGTLLGGSSYAEFDLLLGYIRGIHSWITSGFKAMLKPFFDKNSLEGYSLEFYLPTPSIDKSEVWIKQALAGYQTATMTENEIRSLLEQEELDKAGLEKLREAIAARPASMPMKLEQGRVEAEKMAAIASLTSNPLNPYRVVDQDWVDNRLNIKRKKKPEGR